MIKRMLKKSGKAHKIVAFLLAAVMVLTCFPNSLTAVASATQIRATGGIVTEDDPSTLTRPLDIYGTNTQNAGKITVGKSVSDEAITLTSEGENFTFTPQQDNFLITYSQTAQVMGLSTEIPVPVDAVFVLDTSNSMSGGRAERMVTAANAAIKALLDANENSRVAVVAFSGVNGGGTSGGAPANVLTPLGRYDTSEDHLTWTNEEGEVETGRYANNDFIAGRGISNTYDRFGQITGTQRNTREGLSAGTNIHAGVVLGGQQLMNATDTVVSIGNERITRMPFLIVLSDGAPTYSMRGENWYNQTIASASQQGSGTSAYEGNGFLAVLAAAYYKGAITDKYYGENATEADHCFIYTMGVGLDSVTGNSGSLASITMDPSTYTKGVYATGNNSYYLYGNSINASGPNSTTHSFKTYWDNFTVGNNFNVRISSSGTYPITAATIAAAKNYVNGNRTDSNGRVVNMYTGGIAYNDGYFAVDGSGESAMDEAFQKLVRTIQLKAIASPTQVTTLADYDGYVHYYDPIGEYMEVKNVQGVVNRGHNFKGESFAQLIQNFNTGNADTEFDMAFREAIATRQGLTDAQINELVAAAIASEHQARYTNSSDFDNSLVWWGKSYSVSAMDLAGHTDDDAHAKIQYLAPADNDSVEFIENAKATNTVPEGADYICRSYYYHGSAGDMDTPVSDAMLFVVRVQRQLAAPYKETVVVSIPASLLCVEKVLITEKNSSSGTSYLATVEKDSAVRLVYEVGLRSDINAQNVESVVDAEYAAEKTAHDAGQNVGVDNVEVDANGNTTYYFYTNDWDRTKTESSHLRAMTMVSYDSAPDNDFYRYQEDTPILNANGQKVTGNTLANDIYYYARTVYDWTGSGLNNATGTYNAIKKTVLIPVRLDSNTDGVTRNSDGTWYIEEGTYTSATLLVTGDDIEKSSNDSGTSLIVTHPIRTNDHLDSHYTIYLGNNGRLALTSDKTKAVGVNVPAGTSITDQDGELVTIGDVLTYQIKVVNNEGTAANAVVTDKVPAGTELVSGSISDGGSVDANGNITWNLNLTTNEIKYVTFRVRVTEEVLSHNGSTIQNTATIQVGNSPAYTTNSVESPTYGKITESIDAGANLDQGIKVGQSLRYHIYYYNNEETPATITITDIVPDGTVYNPDVNSITDGGTYNRTTNTITWTLANVQPGKGGVVSFSVIVDASALTTDPITNDASIRIGNNNPIETNDTATTVLTGDLELSKRVVDGDTAREFELVLTQVGGISKLNGTFAAESTLSGVLASGVTFTNGVARVTIKHNETLKIKDLAAGLVLDIRETTATGYTPSMNPSDGQVTIKARSEGTAAVGVTNRYAATAAKFQLKGTKNLNAGGHNFEGGTFSFEVWGADSNWTKTGSAPITIATASIAAGTGNLSAIFDFAQRTFDTATTTPYYYVIDEVQSGPSGITFDTTKYGLKLEIKDDGVGALHAYPTIYKYDSVNDSWDEIAAGYTGTNAVTDSTVTFTNTYEPIEATLNLTAKKLLNNRSDLGDYQFGFVVLEGANEVATGISDQAGNVTFTPITYYRAGNHVYTVKEVGTVLSNVVSDTTEYTVNVSVTEAGGHLTAAITSVTISGTPVANNLIQFTNTYTPDAAEIVLTARKTLENATLTDGAFTFEVLVANSSERVAVGSNDANGNITFSPIVVAFDPTEDYSAPVDLEYRIKEVIPTGGAKDPYMTYDTSEYFVGINLNYDSATGEFTWQVDSITKNGSAVGAAAFTNVKNPESITVTPVGEKITTVSGGTVLPDGTFSFSVVNVETGHTVYSGNAQASASGSAIQFSSLSYANPNPGTTLTYKYWIMESNTAANNGVTYDTGRYLMQVKITNNNGKLEKDVTYYTVADPANKGSADTAKYTQEINPETELVFNNEYAAEGYLNLTATKNLTGRTINDREFTFRLQRLDGSGNVIPGREIEGYNEGNTIKFATLYYSGADFAGSETTANIWYKMSEVKPTLNALPGMTYDENVYYVCVGLSHDTSSGKVNVTSVGYSDTYGGTIRATVTPTADNNGGYAADTGSSFNNSYRAVTGTSATIQATKTLTGKSLNAGEFEFELYYIDGSQEILVASTVNTADATNNIKFVRNYLPTAVIFPLSGVVTYDYVIREHNDHKGGVGYDSTAYRVRVTVTDNHDGTMSNSVEYFEFADDTYSNPIDLSTNVIGFANTYAAAGTDYTPSAKKELIGRTLRAGEFSFEVKEWDVLNQLAGQVVSAGIADANGNVVFNTIGYSDFDTTASNNSKEYNYVITELPGTLGGVIYSTDKYYLRVTVTDPGTGTLTRAVKYFSDAAMITEIAETEVVFENTYRAANGMIALKAEKVLMGRDMAAEEFDFVVKDGSGNIVAYGDNIEAAPDAHVVGVEFSDISFTAAGTYTYWISEVKPVYMNGVAENTQTFKVEVVVTDDGNGRLFAEAKYYDTNNNLLTNGALPLFTNIYTPAPTSVDLTAHKVLVGKDLWKDEYSFSLYEEGVASALETIKNDENGVVAFSSVNIISAGTHVYTIKENGVVDDKKVIGAVYHNDNTVYTAIVEVRDDNAGKLIVDSVKYYKVYNGAGAAGNEEVQSVNFINYYTPKGLTNVDISTQIGATKTVVDPDQAATSYPLAGFEFELTDTVGNVIRGTSNADGTVSFGTFNFPKADEYHYWIREVDNGKNGITYDARQWEVHVHVKHNSATGKLYVEEVKTFAYHSTASTAQTAVPAFVNVYDPAPVSLSITAGKQLFGRNLKNAEFAFQLLEGDLIIAEAHNDAAGNITFTFNEDTVGRHTYTIKEVMPVHTAGGVHYDNATATVVVDVVEDYSGQLKVDGQAAVTKASGHTFNNTYTPAAAKATIQAKKILNGTELVAGTFTFELVDAAGNVIETATNDAAGNVVFTEMVFTQPDLQGADTITRQYAMREKAGNNGNITYDNTQYAVTITVTDDKLGQLHAAVSYGTADGNEPVFVNTYTEPQIIPDPEPEPDRAGFTLTGTKKLIGGTMTEGQFKFIVYHENGIQAGSGTNTADGRIVFTEMTTDHYGKETYTIVEVKGDDKSITYDKKKIQVVVETEYVYGNFEAKVHYPEGGIVFTNVYGNAAPKTGDSSPIFLLLAAFVVCAGGLSGLLVWRRRKRNEN